MPLIIGEISYHEIKHGRTEVWLALLINTPLITVYPWELVLRLPKLAGLDIIYVYDSIYSTLHNLAAKHVMHNRKNSKVKPCL